MPKLLLLVAFSVVFTVSAQAKLLKTTEFTLNNGMPVVVIENHKAPIVKHMVWYKIGAADEAYGKGGVAHLLEHLMFRGTRGVPDGEFNRWMNELGADSNAFTGHDVTVYHQFADINKLEALMALEADRMQNLAFDEKAFAAEQKIVYQERKQVIENNPSSAFYERMNLLLWGNSPYGQPVTGQNDEIMALTYEDAYDFYNKYYVPNNAILILSGDIEPSLAKKLAEKYYGKLPFRQIEHNAPKEVKSLFSETLEMALPDVQTSRAVWQYLLPNRESLQDAVYDFEVLAEYLGGGETSALYRDLVVEQQSAVAVTADFHYVTRGNGVFKFQLIPDAKEPTDKMLLQESMLTVLENAMANLTEQELEKAKRKMLADLVYVNDNPNDAAYWVGYMMANGFSLEDVENYANKIKNVSLDGVQKAYENLLKAPVVFGLLLPENMKGNN